MSIYDFFLFSVKVFVFKHIRKNALIIVLTCIPHKHFLFFGKFTANPCPLISLNHGTVKYVITEEGKTAIYNCLKGYQLLGSIQRSCLPNGEWSGSNSECQSKLM